MPAVAEAEAPEVVLAVADAVADAVAEPLVAVAVTAWAFWKTMVDDAIGTAATRIDSAAIMASLWLFNYELQHCLVYMFCQRT